MTRYFTRACYVVSPTYEQPQSIFGLGEAGDRSCEVFEPDARNTGLLDASGNAIWASDRGPLGFQTRESL